MAVLMLPQAVFAQAEASAAATSAESDTQAITVTGSRIKKDGFDSPVPVTVVDATLIQNLGQTNAADVVKLMPQNVASQSDANSGVGLSANAGAQFANLRGLNSTRTLTLVNSRRFVPSSTGSQVDLNLIPSVMIGRVETVTGGASAAYGSDAVAGVVNVILDNNLTGFKGQLDYGQTGRRDGKTVHGAAAYGLKFGGGRGHVMFGGEYQKNNGIANCSEARDWCAEGWTVVANEAALQPGAPNLPGSAAGTISGYNVPGSSGYGLPNYVLGRNGALVYNSPNGVIRNYYAPAVSSNTQWSNNFPAINPPFAATDKEFNSTGTGVTGFDPGLFGPKTTGSLALGGDNASAYGDQYIQTPLKRWTTYLAAEYELSDALKLTTELTYAKRTANSRSLTAASRAALAFKPDNAYLPPAVAASLNGQAFSLGKDIDDQLDNSVSSEVSVFRGLVGASGALFGDWTWDFYYQYGHTQRDSSVKYSRHNDAFAMAVDAVKNSQGQIICRPLDPALMSRLSASYQTELNALYAQCKPLNMFGVQALDPAAVAFAWRPQDQEFSYRQHVLAGSVQGTLFQGWGAGPIAVAAGLEHRSESGEIVNNKGSITPTGGYSFALGLDYAGKIQVTEGFLETNVPVFRDSAIGDMLELNGAIRFTKNKTTDTLLNKSKTVDVTSWKLGAIYDVTGGLRLRATQSRDIRAAGFADSFLKTAPSEPCTSQGIVNNPNIGGTNKTDCAALFAGGNFDLVPESADTTALGAVFAPTFIPRLRLSLDWYQIKLTDAIANLTAQRVVDLCTSSAALLCDRVTFASPGDITQVIGGQSNVGKMTTRGFDFEASYQLRLSDIRSQMNGSIDARFLLTHQYDLIVQQAPNVLAINYAGQSGPIVDAGDFFPQPKWMWNAIIAYNTTRFNTTMTVRHIGAGTLNMERIGPEDAGYAPTLRNSITTNRVRSATYINLAMSYQIPLGSNEDQYVEVFGGIENLFDKRPSIAPGGGVAAGATAYPTNPVFYDTFGMRWKGGLRLRF
jgi:outer membrane receptor protein involved in Fe transport